ncbi:MAG TPA: membrane-bound PQQ-dependent dehydrogenase, glucose/quinate/shikimate family, partial [Burkholderiaceae bacterium]
MAANSSAVVRPPFAPLVAGGVSLLFGLALLGLGIALVVAGGSWFPAVSGLGFAIGGGLVAARRAAGLAVVAFVVAAMLAWSLWEAGLA